MPHNQKGFIYPITLCVLLLFSIVLTMYTEQYITDKRMLIETEEILKQDYYLLRSVRKIEEILASNNDELISSIDFQDGKATYTISKLSSSLLVIEIKLKMKLSNQEIIGVAYYDPNLKKVVKWVEKN